MKPQAADRPQPRLRGVALVGLCAAALLVLAGGCGEFNDNPFPGGLTVGLGFAEGGSGTSSTSSTDGTSGTQVVTPPPNCEDVKTVVVGAIVIRHSRDFSGVIKPYRDEADVNDANEDLLQADAEQSAEFLRITQAPIPDAVEFTIPPNGAGPWQLVAVGLRNRREAIADIVDTDITWYGFVGEFLNGKVLPGETIGTELVMQRWTNAPAPDTSC